MAKSKRKDGYYWVKMNTGDWIIAQSLSPERWILTGTAAVWHDHELDEIGPRIPDYKPKKKAKSQTH